MSEIPPTTRRVPTSRAVDGATVTVIMPAYNTEKYVGEAISSVLSQTRRDFILHVHDDGSTDGTLEAALSVSDDRCLVTSSTNQGVSAARNLAIGMARTPFIALMDSDDHSLPDRLEGQLNYLAEHPEVAVVGGRLTLFGDAAESDTWWQPSLTGNESWTELLWRTACGAGACAGRIDAFRAVPFDPTLRLAEDYDWECRLATAGAAIDVTDQVVLRYRRHGLNHSIEQAGEVVRATAEIRRKYGKSMLRGPGTDRFVDWLVWASSDFGPAIRDLTIVDSSLWMALGPGLRGVTSERLDMELVSTVAREMAIRQFVRKGGLASAAMLPLVVRGLGLRPALVGVKRGLAAGSEWSLRSHVDVEYPWRDVSG
jgi:glycosyltransferase involved in cell wall biosynthesis